MRYRVYLFHYNSQYERELKLDTVSICFKQHQKSQMSTPEVINVYKTAPS